MRTKLISYDRIQGLLGQVDNPEESTNRRELEAAKRVIATAINQELTRRQRECLTLYYLKGHTVEEVGNLLGVSKSTVSRHLLKARNRLKKVAAYTALGQPR